MPGLRIGRGFAAAVLFAAFIPPVLAEPRPFGALAAPDPAEAAAPADAGLAAACQASARERFGQERLEFGRPSHTARDGLRIVRMDLTVAGAGFRVACSRDGASGPVETAVFAGPVDDAGPRVIVLGGPPAAAAQPRAEDRGYRLVARDPSGAQGGGAAYPGYDGTYLPGLWVPFDDGFRGRRFLRDPSLATSSGSGSHIFVKRSPALETVRGATNRIVDVPRGSSAPFRSGGIASPGISNFNVARGGVAGFRSGGGVRAFGAIGR